MVDSVTLEKRSQTLAKCRIFWLIDGYPTGAEVSEVLAEDHICPIECRRFAEIVRQVGVAVKRVLPNFVASLRCFVDAIRPLPEHWITVILPVTKLFLDLRSVYEAIAGVDVVAGEPEQHVTLIGWGTDHWLADGECEYFLMAAGILRRTAGWRAAIALHGQRSRVCDHARAFSSGRSGDPRCGRGEPYHRSHVRRPLVLRDSFGSRLRVNERDSRGAAAR